MTDSRAHTLGWLRKHEWTIVGCLAGLAFVLGLIGLRQHQIVNPAPWSWLDAIYFVIRLFTFEVDLSGENGDPYDVEPDNWPLQIARFLAPATLAFAVVKGVMLALASNYNLWRISWWRGHAVICGAGERGRRLALALRQERWNVVVIERNTHCDTLDDIRRAGCRVVIGSVTDPARQTEARLRSAGLVVAVTPCVESNLRVVLATSRRAGKQPVRALAYAPRSFAAIFENQPPFARIEDGRECGFFDHDASAARLLVQRYAADLVPMVLRERRPPRILVAGDGDVIPELLAVLVTQCQFASAGVPRVEVFTPDEGAVARGFPLHHPELALVADLHSREVPMSQLLRMELPPVDGNGGAFDLVFAACREDVDTLALARDLSQQEDRITGPVIAGLRPSTPLYRLITDAVCQPMPGVILHDLVELGCSADIVLRKSLDGEARRIHESYTAVELGKGRQLRETPTLVCWEELSDGMRQSNRSQADHALIKRRTLAISTSAETAESLAAAEHRRWMADRIVAGWRYAAKREDGRRLHPSIRPYENLSEEEKDKDRNTVKAVTATI